MIEKKKNTYNKLKRIQLGYFIFYVYLNSLNNLLKAAFSGKKRKKRTVVSINISSETKVNMKLLGVSVPQFYFHRLKMRYKPPTVTT